MTDDEQGGTEATGFTDDSDSTSLAQVNDRLNRIEAIVSKLLPRAHQASEQRVEQRLDRPTTVEEQVKAELAKAERERKAQADAETERKEREDLKATVARLTETRPAPPARRSTKLLGWGDGR